MVSENTKAILVTGGASSLAVAMFIGLHEEVDKKISAKPLGSFQSGLLKGLNEWSTLASLGLGILASVYVIYRMEKGEPLSDIDLAIGTFGITSVSAGMINAFLDPLGKSGVMVDLSKIFQNKAPATASAPAAGRFVR